MTLLLYLAAILLNSGQAEIKYSLYYTKSSCIKPNPIHFPLSYKK